MAKYLSKDKSGILSVLRPLKAADFDVSEVKGDWYGSSAHAHVNITFKNPDSLTDEEKDVLFPTCGLSSRAKEVRFVIHVGKSQRVEMRGVRKNKQKEKLQRVQDDLMKYMKSRLSKHIQDAIDERNAEIVNKVGSENDQTLRNLTSKYTVTSGWNWESFESKALNSVTEEMTELNKRMDELAKKRSKLRFNLIMKHVKSDDCELSEVAKAHVVDALQEKGSLTGSGFAAHAIRAR